MRQKLITLLLMCALGATIAYAAPKHRHHQPAATAALPADSAAQAIEAFSDTTSTADGAYDEADLDDYDDAEELSPEDFIDTVKKNVHLSRFDQIGIGILTFLLIAVIILLLLSPVIIVLWLLRYLIKSHNQRVDQAEAARAAGQPLPQDTYPTGSQRDEYLWNRGVRNAAIGLGLMGLFYFMGAESLVGIGVLILCCGAGQLIIARTSGNRRHNRNDELNDSERQ